MDIGVELEDWTTSAGVWVMICIPAHPVRIGIPAHPVRIGIPVAIPVRK